MTTKQLGMIMYQLRINKFIPKLKKRIVNGDRVVDYTESDCEEWLLKNLDVGEASIVIDHFVNSRPDDAWKQLTHLGLPTL